MSNIELTDDALPFGEIEEHKAQVAAAEKTIASVEEATAPPVKSEPAKDKEEKALTTYYMLVGPEENGPYTLVAKVEANGQIAAKKMTVVAVNERSGDAHEKYFLAIPASSWIPQKPGTVKVETTVVFD